MSKELSENTMTTTCLVGLTEVGVNGFVGARGFIGRLSHNSLPRSKVSDRTTCGGAWRRIEMSVTLYGLILRRMAGRSGKISRIIIDN